MSDTLYVREAAQEIELVDAWRKRQTPMPSRTAAVRMLIRKAIEDERRQSRKRDQK